MWWRIGAAGAQNQADCVPQISVQTYKWNDLVLRLIYSYDSFKESRYIQPLV